VIRNRTRVGVDQSTAMNTSRQRTISVFLRYDIVRADAKLKVMERVGHLDRATAGSKDVNTVAGLLLVLHSSLRLQVVCL
jgi:hypothetical protein